MMPSWSAKETVNLDVLGTVQSGLTVAMIMTPREDLMTCSTADSIADVMLKNTERYSYVPVVDASEQFLGLFEAHAFFDKEASLEQVGARYVTFSEALVIGADASIYDFVQDADRRNTRLVVSGDRVSGLVSISDLQKLPVRTALFTLVTALEMAMSQAISAHAFENEGGWRHLLSDDRQAMLDRQVAVAKSADRYVSDIALTQFCDKASIIKKAKLVPGTAREIKARFGRAENLRNNLAHASFYAETPDTANQVPATVREMLEMKSHLLGLGKREPIHGRA